MTELRIRVPKCLVMPMTQTVITTSIQMEKIDIKETACLQLNYAA